MFLELGNAPLSEQVSNIFIYFAVMKGDIKISFFFFLQKHKYYRVQEEVET